MSIYQKVLVAIDLTEEAPQVLTKAMEISKAHGAEVWLVHVVEPVGYAYGGDIPMDLTELQDQLDKAAHDQLGAYGEQYGVSREHQVVTVGRPESEIHRLAKEHGADLVQDLERMIALHGAETIAAVIVEPVAGSAGVILPPKGYLQRLRELTRQHGILLIFDEVITGFGRVGKPFAANRFGVTPDLMTTAKGLTNGAIPMGAVFAADFIHDAFMHGPESVIELFHGYTYSGHPVAAAAALATLDIYEQEGLFERTLAMEPIWQDALHSLKGTRHVKDIRNIGLIDAIELEAREAPGARGYDVFHHCYWKGNALVRCTGDTIAMSPPLIINEAQIAELIATLKTAIEATD